MEINNCPSCGGKVEFSPDDKALKCLKCSSIFPIEKKKAEEKKPLNDQIKDKGYQEWEESKRTFQCQNCGAQIILNKYEMATKCQYCNTSSLVPTDALPGLKPDAIIPFKISKEKANEVFKVKIKKRMFLPREFKKNLPKTEIGATYFSSFSFGCHADASYHGTKLVSRTIHTKEGTTTVQDRVPFSGNFSYTFQDIVVEASDKLSQNEIEGILPYYFSESYVYNDDFVKGYNVGYYNQTVLEASEVAKISAKKSLESMIKSKEGNVESLYVNPKYSDEKYNYVILPLYFINFKYKDKTYLNLMNGQTGQTSGKVPRSPIKITFFTILMILIFVGLPVLLLLLYGY